MSPPSNKHILGVKEGYRIEKLRKQQVPSVISLIEASFDAGHLLASIYRAAGIVAHIQRELENPLSCYEYFVVVTNNAADIEPAAYCECKRTGTEAVHLNMIAVAPAHKQCGLASMLLDHCINHYRQAQRSQLLLDTAADNRVAMNCYEKAGFRPAGEQWIYRLEKSSNSGHKEKAYIINYPQFTTQHLMYDFGFIEMAIRGERVARLGVICKDIFIKDDMDAAWQPAIFEIKEALGMRFVYFITSRDDIPAALQVTMVRRMALNLKGSGR